MGVLVFGIHDNDMPKWLHFTITLGLCGAALLVSMWIPNISTVFSLMGSTTSSFVCFILPAILTIKLIHKGKLPRPPFSKIVAIFGLAIGGAVLGVASTCITVAQLLTKGKA
eukprot:CAMPEP_0170194294 /NCGR_PEP_ID=MMETSP0040_2-20121228/58907_1 /TAXON_ID=641309 /ORGANISM="Lotharella oceanica, Strain CCMP622" /LENGTH=111 /DNA_ID=CAMNT_0010443181 /DNA_START=15 /DNA_END=353 /DNA_ORIENTATION=-